MGYNQLEMTPFNLQESIRLFKLGTSIADIATQVGVSKEMVRYHLKKRGFLDDELNTRLLMIERRLRKIEKCL